MLAVLFITCEAFVDMGKLPPDFVPSDANVPIVPLLLLEDEVCKFCGVGKLNGIKPPQFG